MSAAAGEPRTGRVRPDAPRASPPRLQLRLVRRNPFWFGFSKLLLQAFSFVWFRRRAEGAHHIPPTGPVLLVANHASYLDPPLVGCSTRRPVAFLAQAGLAKLAPMRWWLGQVGVTLIDRDAPSTAALRLIADSLEAGECIGLFPEGTRTRDGRIGPFRNGVEFLVRRTGAVVVPIGIDGAQRAFPRGAWLPRPVKVVLRIGEPWSPERVLAPGGLEALRREVAALARQPLRGLDPAGAGKSEGEG